MLFSDLLSPKSILVPLAAAKRDDVVAALVGALDAALSAKDRDEFKAAVLAREAVGSTGLGNGIAIPHARTTRVASPRLAVGLAAKPVEFNAADGKPVALFFLLAVPASDPTVHLKVLAALSRLASDKKLLKSLLKAPSAEILYGLISSLSV
jgi:fructose-specific phosphotransferase system IIA component